MLRRQVLQLKKYLLLRPQLNSLIARPAVLAASASLFILCACITPPKLRPLPQACKDSGLQCVEEKHGDSASVMVEPKDVLAATVTITGELENAKANKPLPLTVSFTDGKKFEALKIEKSSDKTWNYHWSYHWKTGVPAPYNDDGYIFRLPYDDKIECEVTQGYQGEYSHKSGTEEEFAIDFRMGTGTQILAARGGKIIAVRQDSNMGGPDPRYIECANYIVIDHGNGSYGMYAHIQKDGALVKLGDAVTAGQPIALSGMTGFATQPHLHFDVFCVVDGDRRRTVPVKFRTKKGVLDRLIDNYFY